MTNSGSTTGPTAGAVPSGDSTAPAVDVTNLTVRYGEITALDGASLSIPRGRVTGLLGMNGSGKSTLFRALMGLARADAGEVRLFGAPSARARAQNSVAYVPQTEAVDWDFPLSVREVVTMGRYGRMGFTRRARKIDAAAVDEALDRVGLASLAHRQIGALSGGQRKRAFVARGIAQDASLLLLDEPFAGVDTASQRTIQAVLLALRAEGKSILVSTHDLAGVPELCDDVVLLQQRVLFHGAPSEALSPERLALTFGVNA